MAVQLPTVDRMNVQQPASVGRLDVQTPNVVQAGAPQQQAFDNVLEQQVEYVRKQQRFAGDTNAEAAANEYSQELENLYSGKGGFKYSSIDADPTNALNDLSTKQKEAYDKVIEKYKNLDEYGRNAVTRKLGGVDSNFNSKKIATYGDLSDKYETKVTNDGVKNEQNNFVEALRYTDLKSEEGVASLDQHVNRIIDLRYNTALKKGVATRDANGQIQTSMSTDLELRKDLSDTVYNALEILNANGDIEGAKNVQARYGKYLEPNREKEIAKQAREAEIKSQSQKVLDSLRNSDPESAANRIEKIKDPDVRDQAFKDYATYTSQRDRLTEVSQKRNYEAAADLVQTRMRGDQPFVDVNDMLKDPAIQRYYNRADIKQRKALEGLVEQPDVSNPQQLSSAFQSLADGTLLQMSFADYNAEMSGISKADRGRFDAAYFAAVSQSEPEKRTMLNYMSGELRNQMIANGVIEYDRYGKIVNKDQMKYINANNLMLDKIRQFPPGTSQLDQQKWVQEYVTAAVKKQAFVPPQPTTGFSASPNRKRPSEKVATQTTAQKNAPPPADARELTPQDYEKWGTAFYRVNRRAAKSTAELKGFIEQNNYTLPQ